MRPPQRTQRSALAVSGPTEELDVGTDEIDDDSVGLKRVPKLPPSCIHRLENGRSPTVRDRDSNKLPITVVESGEVVATRKLEKAFDPLGVWSDIDPLALRRVPLVVVHPACEEIAYARSSGESEPGAVLRENEPTAVDDEATVAGNGVQCADGGKAAVVRRLYRNPIRYDTDIGIDNDRAHASGSLAIMRSSPASV